jgi:hypothetical protein
MFQRPHDGFLLASIKLICSSSHGFKSAVKVKVKVILRLTVCQSVHLGVEPTLGLVTRCCFPLECLQQCPMRKIYDSWVYALLFKKVLTTVLRKARKHSTFYKANSQKPKAKLNYSGRNPNGNYMYRMISQ